MGLLNLERLARAKGSSALRLALSLRFRQFPDLIDIFAALGGAKIEPVGHLESLSAQPWRYSGPVCLEFLKPNWPS